MNITTIKINTIDMVRLDRNDIILDLRSRTEYDEGHIPRAINAPYETIDEKIKTLWKGGKIYLYCERGSISLLTARKLVSEGYTVINLYGGIISYRGKLRKTYCD